MQKSSDVSCEVGAMVTETIFSSWIIGLKLLFHVTFDSSLTST